MDVVPNALPRVHSAFSVYKGGRFVETVRPISRIARRSPKWRHVIYLLDPVIAAEDPAAFIQTDRHLDVIRGPTALPRRLFPFERVVDAFRSMAQGRHVGKIVICNSPASASVHVAASGSYLITGGLSGLGLFTARWLAERSVEHLVLVQRSSPSAHAQRAIAELTRGGTRVTVKLGDVSDRTFVAGLIQDIRQADRRCVALCIRRASTMGS